jgi:osmotically-inducible protein OsmY
MLYRKMLLCLSLITALTGCAGVVIGGAAVGAASIAHDRRSTGTIVEDQSIEFKVFDQLSKDEELAKNSHINVTSYNKAVLLSGEVVTPKQRQKAEDIARRVENVKHVHNELVIAPPSSLSERSNDTLLTSKVKASLFEIDGIAGFDPTRVKVVTERGTVYLFGLLTQAEAEATTSTVRRVAGVQKVVKLFEYINT